MKLNYDDAIVDPNQCLSNYYSDLKSTLVATDNIADDAAMVTSIEADYSFFYTPSFFKLQP